MPRPMAPLLKRPWITLILLFNGSRGESVLLSFMPSPDPSLPHWSSLTPQPRKITPKRFGNAPAPAVAALAANDSSHGRAMVTPAPRRIARRAIRWEEDFVESGILFAFLSIGIEISAVQELRAGDDGFN